MPYKKTQCVYQDLQLLNFDKFPSSNHTRSKGERARERERDKIKKS